ncbi:hypothetical protein SY88_21750 [Clostridiales bacterium PH28_bin88]|nr:hypothetical protein SY88_21750 [Clostridiales bacterium PH28_bin88]
MASFTLKRKTLRHSLAVRLLHWILVPVLLVKILSGLYLNRPHRFTGFRSMNSARKAHFYVIYLFVFHYLARAYYSLVTRDYKYIFPARGDFGPKGRQFILYELFLKRKKPQFIKYNPLQKLIFTGWALTFPLQMITGFILYDPKRFQRLIRPLGGLNRIRQVHYIATLGIASTAAGHLYFALTESKEKLKSIFTGYYRKE